MYCVCVYTLLSREALSVGTALSREALSVECVYTALSREALSVLCVCVYFTVSRGTECVYCTV